MKSQILRFAIVGVAATVTTYAVLIVAVEGFQIDAVIASVVGYAMGTVVNYVLNRRYTFSSTQKHRIAIPKFLAVMGVGMALNAAIMYACINWIEMNYLVAQLAAVGVVLSWSFTINRFWTFAD